MGADARGGPLVDIVPIVEQQQLVECEEDVGGGLMNAADHRDVATARELRERRDHHVGLPGVCMCLLGAAKVRSG